MPRSQGLCANAVAHNRVCSNALNSQRAGAVPQSFGGWLVELTHRGAGPSRTVACVGLRPVLHRRGGLNSLQEGETSEGSRHSDCRRSLSRLS